MKNKKLRYILVPAVLIVWGLVIYKFFSYSDDSPNYNFDVSSNTGVEESIVKIDTFSLIADYRDPFLERQSSFRAYVPSNNSYEPGNNGSSNPATTKKDNKKQEQTKRNIKWPAINYGGLVINQQSAKKVGIMQINGKKYLIEENQLYDNVEILLLTDDSVKVTYLNNNKTFYK